VSRAESVSALQRHVRAGLLDADELRRAEARLDAFLGRAAEVTDLGTVRDQAVRLLQRHALRAADAMQLAAATVAFHGFPKNRAFVTGDDLLARAAEGERFRVIFTGP
jgi:predicted nucleic acid-binding protein